MVEIFYSYYYFYLNIISFLNKLKRYVFFYTYAFLYIIGENGPFAKNRHIAELYRT